MNLIKDTLLFAYSPETITESIKNSGGKLIVKGVVQRAEGVNQNGRTYPRPILERECNRYIETEIAQRRALGELDHPDSSVVNLRNVSHNILNLEWKGNDLIGTIEILNTPSGNILKELFKSGITLGISSRGLGSVKQLSEDVSEIQDDFKLICWDFVSEPSTQGAFMNPVTEGKQFNTKTNDTEQIAHNLIHEIICKISGVCCINKNK